MKEDLAQAKKDLETISLGKKTLEDLVTALRASSSPVEDELEELRELVTRAELIAKYQVDMNDDMASVELGFENVVAQLKILNSEVNLRTKGSRFIYSVKDERVVIPKFLKHFDIVGGSLQPVIEEPILKETA